MASHRMTRRSFAIFSGTAVGMGLLGRPGLSLANDNQLSVRLDWTPWGIHGAFHLAQERGWLSAAGLTLDVQDGNGSASTVQIVGGSSEFDLGHASLSTMMVARSKGLPVRAASVFFQEADIGCIVAEDSTIQSAADLKGKTIAYTAGSLEAPFIDAFLASGGLKRDDVNLVAVSAASKTSVYVTGQADAAFSTIAFFIAAANKDRKSKALPFTAAGLKMPGYGIFAKEETLAGPKRAAISKYCSVLAAAWEYIYDGHQDAAIAAIVAQRPQARLDKDVLRNQIDALEPFLKSSNGDSAAIGSVVLPQWDEAVKTLSAVGLVDAKIQGNDYVEAGLVGKVDLGNVQ